MGQALMPLVHSMSFVPHIYIGKSLVLILQRLGQCSTMKLGIGSK